jgi:hypothetical protein
MIVSKGGNAMTLTRRDLGATVLAALVVLVYAANVQGWWYLGDNRWAAVTMLAIGAIGCPLGARVDEIEKEVTLPSCSSEHSESQLSCWASLRSSPQRSGRC